jgi:hypothetical protein
MPKSVKGKMSEITYSILENEVYRNMKKLENADNLIAETSKGLLHKLSCLNHNLTMIELKIKNKINPQKFDYDLNILFEEVVKVNNIFKKILSFEMTKMGFLSKYYNKKISKNLKVKILQNLNNQSNEKINSIISDLIKQLTQNIIKLSEKYPQAFLYSYDFKEDFFYF